MDLCLKAIHPEIYAELKKRIAAKREEREEKTKEVISTIKEKLKEAGISGKV